MKYIYTYDSILGSLTIVEENNCITNLYINETPNGIEFTSKETPLIREAIKQLNEYFQGKEKSFELPLAPAGTEFQKNVWNALLKIPYGDTCSYSDIAKAIGNPKGCRAIGLANGRNPIPIIIPCHRVIGKNGSLVGYTGGLDIKIKLLSIEGVILPNKI